LNSAGDLGVPKVPKPKFSKLHAERKREKNAEAKEQSSAANKSTSDNTQKKAAKPATAKKPEQKPWVPKLTVPKPFNLIGESITARKLQQLKERMERERIEMEKRRQFKAHPMPDLSKPDVSNQNANWHAYLAC
jgi:chemotaxis protein histidine kinase CheA